MNLKRVRWRSIYSLPFSFLPLPSTSLILMDTRKGITKSKIQIIIHKRGVFEGFTKIKRWVEVHLFPGESSYLWPLQQQMEFDWRGNRVYKFLSLFRKIRNNVLLSLYERDKPRITNHKLKQLFPFHFESN